VVGHKIGCTFWEGQTLVAVCPSRMHSATSLSISSRPPFTALSVRLPRRVAAISTPVRAMSSSKEHDKQAAEHAKAVQESMVKQAKEEATTLAGKVRTSTAGALGVVASKALDCSCPIHCPHIQAKEKLAGAAEYVKETVTGAGHAASDKAAGARDTVAEKAGQAREAAGEKAADLSAKASEAAGAVREKAGSAAEYIKEKAGQGAEAAGQKLGEGIGKEL
jgi:hypothetical protein